MLVKRAIRKENKRRQRFLEKYVKYIVYKSFYKNATLQESMREKRYNQLKKSKSFSISKQYKYCVFSSRIRGTYGKFKMSRHFLKNFASQGQIPGLFKL
jgi:ribosomal protein S14